MELRDLRTFVQVTDSGSMSAAAEQLHLVQSAVSQAVGRLERELDLRLLERSPSGVRPTPAGADLARRATDLLSRVAEAELAMAAYRRAARGSVRLGILPSVVPLVLSSLLRRLRDREPELEVEVSEGLPADLLAALRADHLDIAMLWQPVESRGLDAGHLVDVPLSLVVAHDHRLVDSGVVSVAELEREPWVTFSRGGPGYKWVESACRDRGFTPRIAAELSSLPEITAFVQAGIGITLLPAGATGLEDAAGRIRALEVAPPTPAAALGYVKRRAAGPAPADHVIEVVREVLSTEGDL
jgi:DNA-binding transcriptional LysR family regulator